MPYPGEPSGRHGHGEIAANPDFHSFLETCEPLSGPESGDIDTLLSEFTAYVPSSNNPTHLLAIDGGEYVTSVSENFPSREVLHIRIGSVLIDLRRLITLERGPNRAVDPSEVNRIEKNRDAVTVFLNGANIRSNGERTPSESFRAGLRERLAHEDTKLGARTLLDTVYDGLASRALVEGDIDAYEPESDAIKIHRCPNEDCPSPHFESPVLIDRIQERSSCPACGGPLFATDALRVHEAFNDNQGNQGLVSRTRNLLEHLLVLHYLKYLQEQPPEVGSDFGFVIDGPLAIFGEGARFHRSIMRAVGDMFSRISAANAAPPVIFGVQKSGAVLEFAQALDSTKGGDAIPRQSALVVSDQLRFKHISPRDQSRTSTFGEDTYYGQDVIVKTRRGNLFVINVAYPFGDKRSKSFSLRDQSEQYPHLERVLGAVESVESGLFGGATIPTMLAHRYASISHVPGGRVLDILAQRTISAR